MEERSAPIENTELYPDSEGEEEDQYYADIYTGGLYGYNFSNFFFTGLVDSGDESENGTTSVVVQDHVSISSGRLVALTIFTVFFLVGIVGNMLVIGTTARFGTMRKVVTYLYLVNLSVANLLYLLVCLPTITAGYVLVDWPFGQIFCQMENYIMSISMSVSVLTIVATGLDRYLAIVYPVKSQAYRTTGKTLVVLGSIWAMSLTLMIPRVHLFQVKVFYHIVDDINLCVRTGNIDTLRIDSALTCLFLYVLPLIVLVVCHVRIGQTIWRGGRSGLRTERSYQGGLFGIRERRRFAKIVIAITIVFGIGWLPVHLYHLVENFDYGKILFGDDLDRGTVALFFSFGANALNPLIYCIISGTYRKHITNTLLCRKSTMVSAAVSVRERQPDESHYGRNVPILQPRPALILSSPKRNRTELNRHLLEPHSSDAFTTTISPVSVDELSAIRVSDIDQISTSSLMKTTLVPSPSYLKKGLDMTTSFLKRTSPSLIITDLEAFPDQDKENINAASQKNDIVSQSSNAKDTTCINANDTTSPKAKHNETVIDFVSCDGQCSNTRNNCDLHPHGNDSKEFRLTTKLHMSFPHNRSQENTAQTHPNSQNITSDSSSFSSTLSSNLQNLIEPHQTELTNESNNSHFCPALQRKYSSSNLQAKRQKLVHIKSFSNTNGSDRDTNSNYPFCENNQPSEEVNTLFSSSSSHVSFGTAPISEQNKNSKKRSLRSKSDSLHVTKINDIIKGKTYFPCEKDTEDTGDHSIILSKPKLHKHEVLKEKTTPNEQRKDTKYSPQEWL